MTSTSIVSPMSPAVKRSTRKRQRPSFFAEEITTIAAPSASKKHSRHRASSSSPNTGTRHKQPSHSASYAQSHAPAKQARSELSELHDTVTGLRAQIESATVQMQELRTLVTMLADLYREEQHTNEEPALFSPVSSSSVEDAHDTDEMLSTTASEYDDVYDDEQDELLKTPLSPL